jgi:hypothetical protein
MAVTNEPSDFDIRMLALRYRINMPTNSALSTVFNSTITNMMVIKYFQVMSNKFNIDKICTYGNRTSNFVKKKYFSEHFS